MPKRKNSEAAPPAKKAKTEPAPVVKDVDMRSNTVERNPGIPLDLAWIESTQVNRPAVLRRAATHQKRRCVKKGWQIGWLLRCVSVMDLTTLGGDDTAGNVHRLCMKAKKPIVPETAEKLGVADLNITTGAICVYPNQVKTAVKTLKGTGIPIASVAAGFPAGQTPLKYRLAEIVDAVADGATEIDIVISRELAIQSRWEEMYDEVRQMREACGDAHLKCILATGELPTFRDIYKASLVCMMAGGDFIKTSTGKEGINATLPVGIVMMRAIRDFHEQTGFKVGFKPAGGIRSAKDACSWMALMYEELGEEWTQPHLFRIGASSLLLDVERQLEHGLTGRYAAEYYFGKS